MEITAAVCTPTAVPTLTQLSTLRSKHKHNNTHGIVRMSGLRQPTGGLKGPVIIIIIITITIIIIIIIF